MSLAAESPMHSSSDGDDFAAFLDAELDLASSDTSPDEYQENDDDDGDEDFQEQRAKRRRVEDSECTKELENSIVVDATQEYAGTSSKFTDYGICPPHPGFIKGMCMRCGQVEEDESGVASSYIHKDLRLDGREIDRLREADIKNLLRAKKLILILDLDLTLLNSTGEAEISSEEEYLKHQLESLEEDPNRSMFKLHRMHLITKLRPFVRTFLQEASKMFEMYVYTMGERAYALEIAKILDPDEVYFHSRVISQSDSTEGHQKGLDVVLGSESAVVILDDTGSVAEA